MTELTLQSFGYAPGGYGFKCMDCPPDLPFNQWPIGAKRSWRCVKHAQARLDERKRQLENNLLPFNINHYVLVKLNDRGIEILRKKHDELAKVMPSIGAFKLETDEFGYSKFQLWALMQTFGEHCSLGRVSPFETEILIPKDQK